MSGVVNMTVEDFYQTGHKWKVRLHENGGKFEVVFGDHNLVYYLHDYTATAGIAA